MLVPTIGIEVHVELKSKAKVYSTAKNEFSYEPNTNVTLIDLGYPGTLPKLNRKHFCFPLKLSWQYEMNFRNLKSGSKQ